MSAALDSKINKNKNVREPVQQKQQNEKPARQQSAAQRRTQAAPAQSADIQMFPVTNMYEELLTNKAIRDKRLRFIKSDIKERGMRGYLYEIEGTGQCIWSYRPLGFCF